MKQAERKILRPVLPAMRAFSSIRRARTPTWQWFGIYFFSAVIVLETLMGLGIYFLPGFADFALGYVFPEAWSPFVRALGERLLSEQMTGILASTGMALGVFAVGIFLFPIKEKLSAQFEHDAFPEVQPGRELSLFRQGIEEFKLLALYAVFQSLSFYLGLQGRHGLAVAGTILGYWYLVLAMALDHAAPVFQRRGVTLHRIIYLLLSRVSLPLHFIGAICILPAILLQIGCTGALTPGVAVAIVVGAEVLGMAFATLFGCALGAELIRNEALKHREPRHFRWAVTALTLSILIWQGIFFTWWAIAAHRMSPLLKCAYRLDWRRAGMEHRGRASESGRVATVALSAPVLVTNPTRRRVALEHARVELRRDGKLLGSGDLPTLAVEADTSDEVDFQITFEVPFGSSVEAAPELLQILKWRELEVAIFVYPPLSNPVAIWEWKGPAEPLPPEN